MEKGLRPPSYASVHSIVGDIDPATLLFAYKGEAAFLRLVHRLFVQIERILRINELKAISDVTVETARSVLVIGAT